MWRKVGRLCSRDDLRTQSFKWIQSKHILLKTHLCEWCVASLCLCVRSPALTFMPLSKPAKNCSPSSRIHSSDGWGPSYCSERDTNLPSAYTHTHKCQKSHTSPLTDTQTQTHTLSDGRHWSRTWAGSVFLCSTRNRTRNCFNRWYIFLTTPLTHLLVVYHSQYLNTHTRITHWTDLCVCLCVCVCRLSPWEVCDGEDGVDVRELEGHLWGDVSPGVSRGVTVHQVQTARVHHVS